MADSDDLPVIDFYCAVCDEFQVVRAFGVVISGPVCKTCDKRMKQVQIVQLELGLA